jgi:hypothetical protein
MYELIVVAKSASVGAIIYTQYPINSRIVDHIQLQTFRNSVISPCLG